MSDKIFPCLWFNGNAKEAAELYCSLFANSKITTDTPMVVNFEIAGRKVMGLNGGPMFTINPSISFMVICETEEELSHIWNKLSDGGKIMMGLDKYPWSEKYGWLADRFGMTWQLMLGELPPAAQKITPCFLFVGDQNGKAQSAMKDYTTLFPDSDTHQLHLYQEGGPQPAGYLQFGHFTVSKALFAAMDAPGVHDYSFNEAVSIVAECATQEEIDLYWNTLTAEGKESRCGWLKDKYGVSWQILPANLGNLMTDKEKSGRVFQAIMSMNKIDIETLKNA